MDHRASLFQRVAGQVDDVVVEISIVGDCLLLEGGSFLGVDDADVSAIKRLELELPDAAGEIEAIRQRDVCLQDTNLAALRLVLLRSPALSKKVRSLEEVGAFP